MLNYHITLVSLTLSSFLPLSQVFVALLTLIMHSVTVLPGFVKYYVINLKRKNGEKAVYKRTHFFTKTMEWWIQMYILCPFDAYT